MEVGTICQRLVFTIRRFDEVTRAAQLMREKHVGYLAVVELDPLARPVGVFTDRDIVIGVVARGGGPEGSVRERYHDDRPHYDSRGRCGGSRTAEDAGI